jgi:hypothetical protein
MAETTPIRQTELEVSRGNTVLGGVALLACLPAIFGCLGTFLPELLRQGDAWPVETPWDRLLVDLFTWSVVLAMMSPPATLIGLVLGVVAIRRAGRTTVFGRTLAWILAGAVMLSLAFAGQMIWTVKHTKYPRTRVTQSVASCRTRG